MQDATEPKAIGIIFHVPDNVLRIQIDDDKPFLLKNLDRRFAAENLGSFLEDFARYSSRVKQSPCILVESETKRVVTDEELFNQHLQTLALEHGVNVIYMPSPTGRDPDADLRAFVEKSKKSDLDRPAKKQRTIR
ncbi:MAG: hypothetical protein WKF77_06375 [Planctomycetaceae bacterium]